MKLTQLIVLIFSLFAFTNALAEQDGGDKKTTTTQTSVWVTITSKGQTQVVQTVYSQSFMSTHTEAVTDGVKSGNVGLASDATDSVGGVRSYKRTTITQPNNGHYLGESGIYSGLLGAVLIVVGLL